MTLAPYDPAPYLAQFAATFEPADPVTAATAPVAVASGPATGLTPALRDSLTRVNESVGMSIPAVRRAVHVIAGTISTFALAAWRDGIRLQVGDAPYWIEQPDPVKTLTTTLFGTLSDAIWRDRSYWHVMDVAAGPDGRDYPLTMRRIQPDRVNAIEDVYDPDILTQVSFTGINGDKDVPLSRVIQFNWAGVGGLRRWGWDMLDLYVKLQEAAGRYATAPHPKAILRNHGADLTEDQIDALLAQWEAARDTRSVGYLNDVVDYETFGWNAAEMQLNDAREYAALEVARLFGLPAWALDASGGDSMTYSNVTDRRLDLLEALRPWMTPVEQTLSMQDRSPAWTTTLDGRRTRRGRGICAPPNVSITFDASAYTRDSPEARMRTWQTARAANILTVDEIRRVEPLADLAAGSPDQPGTPPPAPPAAAGVGAPAPGGTVNA